MLQREIAMQQLSDVEDTVFTTDGVALIWKPGHARRAWLPNPRI